MKQSSNWIDQPNKQESRIMLGSSSWKVLLFSVEVGTVSSLRINAITTFLASLKTLFQSRSRKGPVFDEYGK